MVTLDNDVDNDNTHISIDNCPSTPNPDQLDFDNDSIGDLCDEDIDEDGVPNITEIMMDKPKTRVIFLELV